MASSSREFAVSAAARLREAGYEALLVGGCVRDRLLQRSVNDYDLATNASPAQVKSVFPEALEVGAHFGVMLIKGEGEEVQIATYRSESSYRDGRHPEQVRWETDARRDAERRDFTINGLFENPFTGEVVDYVGGQEDLRHGLIRAIGDPRARFQEDHLRMLRAVRFSARLGFEMEAHTFAAIREMAASIQSISAERVRDELERILTEGAARRGFELLDETGLLEQILPEICRLHGVPQPPQFHPEGDVWNHTMLVLEHLPAGAPVELAWSALLHDAAKPVTMTFQDRIRFHGHDSVGATMAREILTRLRVPGGVIDDVVSLIANHMRMLSVQQMGPAAFKRFLRVPRFELQLELNRLDCLGSYRSLDRYDSVKRRWEEMPEHELRPAPLLNGSDLIEMGYRPGPLFSSILHAVEDAQLAHQVETREEALAFVRERYDTALER